MKLEVRKIGNSFGVILPKSELEKIGKAAVGETVEIELVDDPFWIEIEKYSKEERMMCNQEDFPSDDFDEWNDL